MYKDPQKQLIFQRHWQRAQRLKRKTAAIEFLGGRCKRCGYKENIHALQIDHIKPVLRSYRGQESGSDMYRRIMNGSIKKEELQVLCANCHSIKTFEEDRKSFKGFIW